MTVGCFSLLFSFDTLFLPLQKEKEKDKGGGKIDVLGERGGVC